MEQNKIEEINNNHINPEDLAQKKIIEKKPTNKNINKVSSKEKFNLLYNKRNKFHISPFHYYLMSLSLFILSNKMIGWVKIGSTFCKCIFTIIGTCQYIIGLFDFFQGKTIRSLFNFVLGIFHMTFLFNTYEINGLKQTENFGNPPQCIAFIFLFWIILSIIGINEYGLFNLITLGFFLIGFAFGAIWGVSDGINILEKISGYAFFVSFLLFFFVGFALTINIMKQDEIIPFVLPGI